MGRLIIVDECLNHQLTEQLIGRGRPAVSGFELGLSGLEDEPMLRKLHADVTEPWVLITSDDVMPAEHADVIDEIGATIATIDGEWDRICKAHDLVLNQDEFGKEAIHRWAHVIAEQEAGQIHRYTPVSHTPWRARTKHEKKAEQKAKKAAAQKRGVKAPAVRKAAAKKARKAPVKKAARKRTTPK